MLKLLITTALVYFVYRFFIAPPAIDQEHADTQQEQKSNKSHEDEYIDYEEVD